MENSTKKIFVKNDTVSMVAKQLTIIALHQENLRKYSLNLLDKTLSKSKIWLNSRKYNKARPKILIVGCESDMINFLDSVYCRDCDIITRHDPISACMWINEGNLPALIICQFNFPYFKSESFIQIIRSISFCDKTHFIILSDDDNFNDKLNHSPLAAVKLIGKAFDPAVLKESIQNVLKRQSFSLLEIINQQVWPKFKTNVFLVLAILSIALCARYNLSKNDMNATKHTPPNGEFKKLSRRDEDNPYTKSALILSTAD